jgi:uncharacterized repeat protein (TIGR01451 family)
MDDKPLLSLTSATLTAVLLLATTWAALHAAAVAATTTPLATTANPGDVVVNEVAWGGTAASSADEWIELYNTTAQPLPLAGWRLYSADGGPDVTLSGSIPPHGYYLIERTADDTVSDVPADWIGSFGTGLSNSGEVLTLTDQAAQVIDTANQDGGGWPAGSGTPGYYAMERVAPQAPDADDNWAANDGLTRNGRDAAGQPINGTPKARNSTYAGPPASEADLEVDKSGPATAPAGSRVTYTLYLSNTGSLTATAVRLTDSLPAAVTFISQNSPFPFDQGAGLLVWSVGDLPTHTPPLLITVTGRLSATASGLVRNVVTATTTAPETLIGDNHALWETRVAGDGSESTLLIAALLYDGHQADDRDEALQLINVSDAPADLSGWKICDGAVGATCATILSGTLGSHDAVWLAYWASDFYTSSGFYPAYAVKGIASGTLALSGTWPRYANAGEAAVLRDPDDRVIDTLVYQAGDTNTWGWTGAAVEPWGGGGMFRAEGQILYRQLNEATALPVPDTDSAADWAQYAADPLFGRRVRYPGWDLETFFQPLNVTAAAHLTVGVAPDNAADVLLDAIASATGRVEIAVYALTHPTVIAELVNAAQAGVTVTILLEGDQAGVAKSDPRWYQQMWACQRLYDTAHGACWFMISDDQANVYARYRFMHAKYVLIDRQRVLITSQNLTDRGLPDDDRSNGTSGSRGVLLLTDAPAVVARVAQLFDRDLDPAHHADLLPWSPTGSEYGPPPPTYTPVLSVTDYTTYTVVFSTPLTLEDTFDFELFTAPEAAVRQSDALLGLLAHAGAGDQVYVEALDERAHWGQNPADDPNPRIEAYLAAARRGARVRILLNSGQFDAPYYDASNNLAAVAYANAVARDEGLDLRATTGDPTQFGIHNKMILVWLAGSGGYVHLGSLNGSETSSKANRELALQVHSDQLYHYLKEVFDWDWHISNPLYLPFILRDWSPPAPPVGYPVISEVLYDPPGVQEGGEWIELYNPTGHAVDLAGWYLGDVGPAGEFGSGLYTFPAKAVLPADGVILVARQAQDVVGFTPDYEFLIDPLRDDPDVENMGHAGDWDGFGFALGNAGDEAILLDAHAAPVDALVYGTGRYPGVTPHPGVSDSGHSLERRPAIYDTDDCSHDFFDRNPPAPGSVSHHYITHSLTR